MSGGHFDYAQYRIDDIIASIEREIECATCEWPPMVTEQRLIVKQKIKEGVYSCPSWCDSFRTFESAEKYFKDAGGYDELERSEVNGKRKLVLQDVLSGDVYEISTYTWEHYEPDENGEEGYFPDYSKKTLKEFRRAIDLLKRASIYANRIDMLLSGDDGENTFHKRLEEDLKGLEEV